MVVTETVYVPVEQRRRSPEQQALEQAIAELIAHYLDRGIAKVKPLAGQWWRETARPAIAAQRVRVLERRSRRKGPKTAGVVEASEDLVEAAEDTRLYMSSAEAKTRYLAALAARAYSDEQMRLVTGTKIVDGDGHVEWEHPLAELPSDQVRALIEAMAMNPSMLGEDTLAGLASLLGRRALG